MIVGIDLGTTNSLVGVFRDGRVELIPNALGDLLTPSVVAVDTEGRLLVGLAARELGATAAGASAATFKRLIGTERTFQLPGKSYRAEELSAIVLGALKADAENFFGEPVAEAVITVPAYFNESQRRATRAAGELAGLRVERLLNEPTAAGLAYGLKERDGPATFLIFDLGGGTFDVSVLEYFEGVVEVRASAGDTRLGGEDFVDVLVRIFIGRCGIDVVARSALLQGGSVRRAAEQAKRDLTDAETATMAVTDAKVGRLECSISRDEFESASADLLQRLRRPIERALRDAKIDETRLDEVVLVGGATRMPMIRQLVTRLFQRLPLRTIDPDLVVAHGAAIQAGLKARDAALEEVVLTDVMPFSLGIVVSEDVDGNRLSDRFSPIIERNTPVPVSRVQSYSTTTDNQRTINLDVRQGESPIGSDNLHLGKLDIDVPARKAGQVGIDVRFSYDANGLLDVDASDRQTGHATNALIRNMTTGMSPAEIERALAQLRVLKVHPRDEQENRYLVERAKRLYEDRLGHERETIQGWLSRFESTLETQDAHTIRRARLDFRGALDSIDHSFRL